MSQLQRLIPNVACAAVLLVLSCQKSSDTAGSARSGAARSLDGIGVSPAIGLVAGGERVSLIGAPLARTDTVLFGSSPCTELRIDGAEAASCLTPVGSEGPVDVVFLAGTESLATLPAAFTYLKPLDVASVTPATGKLAGGDRITIAGSGFYPGATVLIGDGACTSVSIASSSSLTCVSPARPSAGVYDITITNVNKQRVLKAAGFAYVDPPSISAVAPASGSTQGGTKITLLGGGFATGAQVFVGTKACTEVSVDSASSIECTTPAAGAGPSSIIVVNPDTQQATLKDAFAYVSPPSVAAVSPNSGTIHGGTQVTISGSGFLEGAAVKIGDLACAPVQVVNAATITCATSASGAGSMSLAVTNPDGQASLLADAFQFLVNANPSISSVAPTTGPIAGATTIVITGTNFFSAPVVTIDGAECGSLTMLSSNQIQCLTPPGTAGVKNVVVTNSIGYSATRIAGFLYSDAITPVISSVSPTSGPLSGGTTITITGTGFLSGATVTIGGGVCTSVNVASSMSLTCVTPSGSSGSDAVVLVNPDGLTATRPAGYAFTNGVVPTISSITPNFGPPGGGTTARIQGSGFDAAATVQIGGVSCATLTAIDANTLDCVTAAGTFGAKNVLVVNPDQQQQSVTGGFTYRSGQPPSATLVSPNYGPAAGGTTITITGANFLSGAVVQVNGISCGGLVFGSSTQLSCITPAGSYGGKTLTVINPDGQSVPLANGFNYSNGFPPIIASVDPNFGPLAGGTTVTVNGSGFIAGAQVLIGGYSCPTVVFVDSTALQCVTPPGSFGARTVTVTNPDAQTIGASGGFTYSGGAVPTIQAIYPTSGRASGGNIVSIVGAGFQAEAVASIGGLNCATTTFISSSMLNCAAPVGALGGTAKTVTVLNPDTQQVGLSTAYTYTASPTFPYVEMGTSDDARFGATTIGMGDINADGIPDFAVGEALALAGGVAKAGKVYVYSGASGALLCTLISPAPTTDGAFGAALASTEASGDSINDLIVGEPGATATALLHAGKVHIFSGAAIAACATPPLATVVRSLQAAAPEADANFGFSLATGQILGTNFIVVGEPYFNNGGTDQGRISTFTATTGGVLYTASSNPAAAAADLALYGFSVATADMNGDGRDDIIVGEPGAPNTGTARGRVYALSGLDGTTQIFSTALVGAADNNRFGYAVAKAGRINGDAKDDIIVGEPYNTTGQGKVYVYGWISGATVAPAFLTLSSPTAENNSLFGLSVASTGDLDGDGKYDILVGQPYATCSGTARGRVVAFSGIFGNALVNNCGTENNALAGKTVAYLGDVNSDGLPDFLFTEPFGSNGGVKRGRVTVYLAP